jgi:hypothetical protein
MPTRQSINYFLFKILIISAFYGGMHRGLLWDGYLVLIRNVVIGVLFCSIVSGRVVKKPAEIFSSDIVLFYIYHFIVGICSFPFFLSISSFLSFLKISLLPFSVYLFYCFFELTNISFKRLLKFFIKVGVSFVILNTAFYFIELPIWKENRALWYGRISVGYPTMDVVSLSYALITLLFFNGLKISNNRRILYACLIFAGMLLQFSGTGIFLLSVTMLASLFLIFFKSTTSLRINTIKFLLVIPILIFLGYSTLNEYDPILLETSISVAENRTSILLGEDPQMNSMKARKNEYKRALRYQDSDIKEIFGIGFGRVTFNTEFAQNPEYVFIEDQYLFNKRVYGYIGHILFIIFILLTFWKAISMKNISLSTKLFCCLCVIAFAAGSKTGVSLYEFPFTIIFALFYAILIRLKNGKFA